MCLFINEQDGKAPEFVKNPEDITAYAIRIKNPDGSIESPLNTLTWLKGVVEYLPSDEGYLRELLLIRHFDNIGGQYINNDGEIVNITKETGFGEYVLTKGIFHLFKHKSDAEHLMQAWGKQNEEELASSGLVLVLCEYIIPAGAMVIEGHTMFMETGHCEDRYESYGTTAAMLSSIIAE